MNDEPRIYDAAGIPLATAAPRDPGNTDPDKLTAALDPDDDVYALVNQDQGDLRETAPVGEEDGSGSD